MDTLWEKRSIIPLNKNEYFKIIKSDLWEYAIEIGININEEIDVFNLFMILKSYVWSNKVICMKICVCWKEESNKLIIMEVLSTRKIRNIDFNSFLEWYYWRIESGLERSSSMNRKDDILSIIIVLDKNLLALKKWDLNNLTPSYPWNKSLLNKYGRSSYNAYLIEKIDRLEKKVRELEKGTLIDGEGINSKIK